MGKKYRLTLTENQLRVINAALEEYFRAAFNQWDVLANRMEMLLGHIRPAKKPDCDNVEKIICDALNGCAYKDDAQIVRCTVIKYYSETPRVEVDIQEANHEQSKTERDP